MRAVVKRSSVLSGDLEAAEAGLIACIASWPGCGEGHMKLAQILRAKGESEKVSRTFHTSSALLFPYTMSSTGIRQVT